MTDEQVTPDHRDWSLSVCAAPVTGAPEWLITTRSRRLADAAATLPGGTVHARENGGWQARLPEPVLAAVILDADAGALRCRLSALPCLGVFALAFAPWPATLVLRCPLTALPTQGRLSVRDVRVTTRMGRTVRYLIPAFTMS